MDKPKTLWIDLRLFRDQDSYYQYLREGWQVSYITTVEGIEREIYEVDPRLLCFEYDYPDVSSLSALQQVKSLYPSMPLIMLTEQHSESLAIWALRIRVWDYLVKPLRPQDIAKSAAATLMQGASTEEKTSVVQQPPNLFTNPLPVEVRFRPSLNKKTYPAQTFVETHYHEKIYEEDVARLCGMNVSTFSRSFRKEYKTTFRNYLINYRIFKARELLQDPNAMVKGIAYTVGFHDPSYFTRTFRRIVGIVPSHYQQACGIR